MTKDKAHAAGWDEEAMATPEAFARALIDLAALSSGSSEWSK